MKRAPTDAPMPIPAFSPVLRPLLGSAVRVGSVVGELWVEIVRAVGGITAEELGVAGLVVTVDGVEEYRTLEGENGSNEEVDVVETMIIDEVDDDVGSDVDI